MTTVQNAGRPGLVPRSSRTWAVVLPIVLLSLIPVAAGVLRLVQVAGGPAIIPADHRYADFPAPLIVHIVSSIVFLLVGAFQLAPRFRRGHLRWHRRAGRVLGVAGMLVAFSAIWMTLFYERHPGTTDLIYVLRLAFGSFLAAALVIGIRAARNGDLVTHRAWMIRAYVVALAAGSQAVTEGVFGAIFGTAGIRGDLAKASSWVIGIAVAEWIIRRPARQARLAVRLSVVSS